jgi:small-conductance mechanosensitive channel
MPDFPFLETLRADLSWAPGWVFSFVLIALALAVALYAYHVVVKAVGRGIRGKNAVFRSLVIRTRGPVRLAIVIGAVSWAVQAAPLADGLTRWVQHGLLVGFIVLCGWALMTAADIGAAVYIRRYRTDDADNLHARKLLTQTRILRRSLNVLVLMATIAMALMTVPGVKQLGVSLLAAGGAAGIILGLALQPVLSNVMAGFQLAFTQPIRIDDAVTVQGEFGWVEEIKSTYVVIRLRDLRRMIVPLKFFLEQPFQNWTRDSADLQPETKFQVDQRVPMDRLREVIETVVKASALWDGKTLKVQLNDILEKTLEVRVVVSARNSADATELRSQIREGVLAWLQREMPGALPGGLKTDFDEPARPPSAPGPRPGDQRVQ